jgi:hypothetical protein
VRWLVLTQQNKAVALTMPLGAVEANANARFATLGEII